VRLYPLRQPVSARAPRIAADRGRLKSFTVRSKPTQGKCAGDHLADPFAHPEIDFLRLSVRTVHPHVQEYFHRTIQVLLAQRSDHGSEIGADPRVAKVVSLQTWGDKHQLFKQARIGDREI